MCDATEAEFIGIFKLWIKLINRRTQVNVTEAKIEKFSNPCAGSLKRLIKWIYPCQYWLRMEEKRKKKIENRLLITGFKDLISQ